MLFLIPINIISGLPILVGVYMGHTSLALWGGLGLTKPMNNIHIVSSVLSCVCFDNTLPCRLVYWTDSPY